MTISTDINRSRRAFGIGAVSAVAGLTIGFRWASAQGTPGPRAGPPVPPMIRSNPQLDAWVRIAPDGTVTVMTGRVELGQGMLTAMRQVAADELDVTPEPVDGPLPNGAAARNAVPIYAAANQTVTSHYLAAMPIRTSALRTLGGYFNAVSAEMFIDELAAMTGRDPVAFRLANVKDVRLHAVLTKAVEMSGWKPSAVARRPLAPEMVCTGVGLSRYKNGDAYVAVVAEVSVNTQSGVIRPLKLWSATDAGRAVNPDGVLNQVDGGMAQATSWTLQEAGRWDSGIMKAVDYSAYPIQDFVTTPAMHSVVIDRPDQPSLGAGEGSQAPAGAAIANAVFAATGRRIAEIPFTPERVLGTLRA